MHKRKDFDQADPAWDLLEAQWMADMAHGSPEVARAALALLHRALGAAVIGELLRKGISAREAPELAQEVWIEVAKAAARYQPTGPVRLFVWNYVKFQRSRYWSRNKAAPPPLSMADEVVENSAELALLAQSLYPSGDWDHQVFFRCVRRAFSAFEQKHPLLARLLILKHVEEQSLAEIAELLGQRAAEIKAEVFSARNKFRPLVAHCLSLWPNP